MSNRLRDLVALSAAVAVPLAAGGLGSIATASSVSTWYRELNKPSWNPPSWVFGPVWTTLYVMMGVAAWLVWREGWKTPRVRVALGLFGAQLVFNVLWSVIFFGLRLPGWALVEITALWGLIVATTVSFFRVNVIGGLLLVPYLLWVTFATGLNGAIWWLNR